MVCMVLPKISFDYPPFAGPSLFTIAHIAFGSMQRYGAFRLADGRIYTPPAGTYFGSVVVSEAGVPPAIAAVTLQLTGSWSSVSLAPLSLGFVQNLGTHRSRRQRCP